MAAPRSLVLSVGIILVSIPFLLVGLARGGQLIETPPPGVAHFLLAGTGALFRSTLPLLMITQGGACLADIIVAVRIAALKQRIVARFPRLADETLSLGDDFACLVDIRYEFGIERRHELPQLGGLHPVNPPRETVYPALWVEDHVVSAVAARERIAALLKRGAKRVGSVAGLECSRHIFLYAFARNAGALLLLKLGP